MSQLSTRGKIAKNFVSLVAGNVLAQFFAIFSTVYLARILGATSFGKIAFAQGIIAYFSLITDFGLTTVGTREVAKKNSEIKEYVSNLLALRLLLAIISFALLIIFLSFVPKPIDYKVLIALFGLTLFPQIFLLNWLFKGIERMEFTAISDSIRALFYLILVFLFIKSSANLLFVPIFFIISYAVAAVFLIYIFIKKFGRIRFSFKRKTWKYLLYQAIPLGLSTFILQIGSNSDVVLLGFIKGDATVGWYSAAYKLVFVPVTLAGLFLTAVFPVMARLYNESLEKLQTLVQFTFKVVLFTGFPIAVGGMILAPELIPLIYGSKYQPSIFTFQILMWYVFIAYAYAPVIFLLPACNKQKYFFYTMATGAVVNIVMNLLLIPKYSLAGAAVSTVVGHLVIFVMLYIYSYKKIVPVNILKDLLIAGTMATAMGIVMTLINSDMHIFGKFLVGFIFYLIFFILIEGRKWKKIYKEGRD